MMYADERVSEVKRSPREILMSDEMNERFTVKVVNFRCGGIAQEYRNDVAQIRFG